MVKCQLICTRGHSEAAILANRWVITQCICLSQVALPVVPENMPVAPAALRLARVRIHLEGATRVGLPSVAVDQAESCIINGLKERCINGGASHLPQCAPREIGINIILSANTARTAKVK